MNESELETTLRALRPAQPPADVSARIAEHLDHPPSKLLGEAHRPASSRSLVLKAWIERALWAGVGAAAAIAIMRPSSPPRGDALAASRHTVPTAPPAVLPPLQPTVQEEELGVSDDGIRFVQAGTPVKKVRRVVLERQAWRDPKDGGLLEVQWPREDVIFVPVPQE